MTQDEAAMLVVGVVAVISMTVAWAMLAQPASHGLRVLLAAAGL